ncbi:MAG TPA: hypothetical protein VFQ60_00635 [Patescibacteria group bacterium]|nr:hypothetical protein [Patescibacteria group bacterium]
MSWTLLERIAIVILAFNAAVALLSLFVRLAWSRLHGPQLNFLKLILFPHAYDTKTVPHAFLAKHVDGKEEDPVFDYVIFMLIGGAELKVATNLLYLAITRFLRLFRRG